MYTFINIIYVYKNVCVLMYKWVYENILMFEPQKTAKH